MKNRGINRILTIVGVCAVAGALAGIAGSAAAPSKSKSSAATAKAKAKAKAQKRAAALRAGRHDGGRGHRPGGRGFGFRMGLGGPPVHSESVVPNADGTGFDTVTMDSGNLESIDGTKLTIKEGTDKATYKTVEIDVGSDAKVVRNHEEAKLSDLKADDNVHVIQGPKGNFVMAESDDFRAQERKEHGDFRRGAAGPPPPPDAPPGPPPTGA